jgi:phospholipid transport system substrate-binding protein
MCIRNLARGWLASLILMSSFAAAAVQDPQQMVREAGSAILAELSTRQAEFEADPKLIYPFVEDLVLPHFDFRKMSQSAMGRYWPRATEDQKARLTNEFRELLVRTYATALLGYSGQEVEYLPVQFPDGATRVTIPTRLSALDAPPIPVNYRLQLNSDEKWLVYDVVIDGVSLITTYRSQFSTLVRRDGIDGLISQLAAKNRD